MKEHFPNFQPPISNVKPPVSKMEQTVAEIEREGPNTLSHNLVKFAHVLRRLGIRVSTAETRDALDALSQVDIMDRDQVKGALSAALVKSCYDQRVFNLAFDLFFVPPEVKQERLKLRRERLVEREKQLQNAGAELAQTIREGGRDWVEETLERLQLTEEQRETLARLPEQERKRLMDIFSRMQGNPVNSPSDLIARTIQGSLDYWRYRMLKEEQEEAGEHRLDITPTGVEELDEIIEAVAAGLARERADDQILHEDMKNIAEKDLPRVTLLIKKLSRHLATRISRRYHRSNKRHRLDIRRTIRKNIRFGGTLLELKYRTRKVQKPRLVLICDVSASMARYAVFVIQFIYGLSSVIRNIESFIFSEDLERVTPYFKNGGDFAGTMASLMSQSGQWGRATNLHTALTTFLANYQRLLSPDVFVIIVSDTKTLEADQAARDLAEIRSRVRDIIWLNTLPRKEWKDLPATAEFQKYCRMFECYTLAHLNKVLRGQMLSA